MDEVAVRAKAIIGQGTTSQTAEMRVYVAVQGNALYLHSNFLSADSDNPTKISTTQTDVDLETLAYNLVFTDKPDEVADRAFRQAFAEDIEFDVEHTLFADPRFGALDFGAARKVKVICDDRVLRTATRLGTANDHPRLVVNYYQGLLANVNATGIEGLLQRLHTTHLDMKSVVLLPILGAGPLKHAAEHFVSSRDRIVPAISTAENLSRAISAERGRTIIVIGQIEHNSYVVGDGARLITVVDLPALASAAESVGSTLFLINMRSAPPSCRPHNPAAPGPQQIIAQLDAALSLDNPDYLSFLKTIAGQQNEKTQMALVMESSKPVRGNAAAVTLDFVDGLSATPVCPVTLISASFTLPPREESSAALPDIAYSPQRNHWSLKRVPITAALGAIVIFIAAVYVLGRSFTRRRSE